MTKRKQSTSDPISAARAVAQAEVARRWPELASVEPTVSERRRPAHAEEAAGRVGAALAGPTPAAAEYTFTFAGHVHTAEGYTLPRIARVTVDAHRRVVKATTSK